MHVVNSIHHLMKVCSGNSLWKFPGFSYKIEKFSSTGILEHNGEATGTLLIGFFVDCWFFDAYQLNEILMNEFLHDCQLLLEGLEGRCFVFVLLYRHVLIVEINSQLHSMHQMTLTRQNNLNRAPWWFDINLRIHSLPSCHLPFKKLYNIA
jgi:hypothetical protein